MTALNREVADLGEYSATAHNANGETGAPVAATGATAGAPGSWTPAGSAPPASVAALQAGSVTASPATVWTTGQYVQTGTAGAAGQAHWSGTAWVTGAAALAAHAQDAKASKPDAKADADHEAAKRSSSTSRK